MNQEVIEAAISRLPACVRCREKRLVCDKGLETCGYCHKAGAECLVVDGDEVISKSELRKLIAILGELEGQHYEVPGTQAFQLPNDYSLFLFQKTNDNTLHFSGPTGAFSVAARLACTKSKDTGTLVPQPALSQSTLEYLGLGSILGHILESPIKHLSDSDMLLPGIVSPLVLFFLDYSLICGDLQPVLYSELKSLIDYDCISGDNSSITFQITIICALALDTLSLEKPDLRILSSRYFEIAQNSLSSSMETFSEDTVLNTYLISLYYLQNPRHDTTAWYSTIWTCIVLGELEYQGSMSELRRELFWVNYVLELEMCISKCMPSAWSGRTPTLDYSPAPSSLTPVISILNLEEEIISKLYLEIHLPANLLEVVDNYIERIEMWATETTKATISLRLQYYQALFLCLKPLSDRNFLDIANLKSLYETSLVSIIEIYSTAFYTRWAPDLVKQSFSDRDALRPFNIEYVNGLYRACVCLAQLRRPKIQKQANTMLLMKAISILSKCIDRWPYIEQLKNNLLWFMETNCSPSSED